MPLARTLTQHHGVSMPKVPSYVARHRAQIQARSDNPSLLTTPGVGKISTAKCHPHLVSHIGDGNQEHAIVIGVSHDGTMLGHELIHKGEAHMTPMAPRDVFRRALAMGANAVVIAHNHPTGPITPSAPDIDATRGMIAAGAMIQVPVVDHLIFNRDGVYSMRDHDYAHPCWTRPKPRGFYGMPSFGQDMNPREMDDLIKGMTELLSNPPPKRR